MSEDPFSHDAAQIIYTPILLVRLDLILVCKYHIIVVDLYDVFLPYFGIKLCKPQTIAAGLKMRGSRAKTGLLIYIPHV